VNDQPKVAPHKFSEIYYIVLIAVQIYNALKIKFESSYVEKTKVRFLNFSLGAKLAKVYLQTLLKRLLDPLWFYT